MKTLIIQNVVLDIINNNTWKISFPDNNDISIITIKSENLTTKLDTVADLVFKYNNNISICLFVQGDGKITHVKTKIELSRFIINALNN